VQTGYCSNGQPRLAFAAARNLIALHRRRLIGKQ
jgi:hypothetical protein